MTKAVAAAVDRHPHLAGPVRQGWVRVDMHSHTMWSGDATTTPEEVVQAVADSGIDVLCVTDHSSVVGAHHLAAMSDAGGLACRVVVGIEARTWAGEIIGLFLSERPDPGLKPADLARSIRDQGGLVYVPHPFDPLRNCLRPEILDELVADGLIDIVEVLNAKTSLASLNAKADDFARVHGLLRGAGSDAHVPAAVGAAYVEMPDFTDAGSFATALESAVVVGHYFDPPRPWKARIVPSTPSF